MFVYFFFFFKQKTAYEMRISDWSSDVCSSDLRRAVRGVDARGVPGADLRRVSRHPAALLGGDHRRRLVGSDPDAARGAGDGARPVRRRDDRLRLPPALGLRQATLALGRREPALRSAERRVGNEWVR